MIKHCEFFGKAMYDPYCSELVQGSVKMFAPAFGVCYAFNFQGVDGDKVSAYSMYGGPEWGLQLILDVEG